MREDGDRGGEALALNNIGVGVPREGRVLEAQTYFERALDIREQPKVPREIADTLHNLGETLSRMGKYDQALSRYLRALEARRADGDTRTAAKESYSIGTIFDYQGRYGAAVKSKGEALQAFRGLKQRDFWLGEILSGLGYSLALAGRSDEASKNLDEALALARELKHADLDRAGAPLPGRERVLQRRRRRAPGGWPERRCQAAARRRPIGRCDIWARFVAANMSAAAQPTQGHGGYARADRTAGPDRPGWPTSRSAARCSRPTRCSGPATTCRHAAGGASAGAGRNARAPRAAGAKRVRRRRRTAAPGRRAGPATLRDRASAPRGNGSRGRQREGARASGPEGDPVRVRAPLKSAVMPPGSRSSPNARPLRRPVWSGPGGCPTTRPGANRHH